MTEADWLSCDDPQRMLTFACCLLVGRKKEIVGEYEKRGYFDDDDTLLNAPYSDIQWAMGWTERGQNKPTMEVRAALLRDIFGNPFRPILVTDNEWRIEHEQLRPGIYEPRKTVFRTKWLAWNDGLVQKLAQTIYDERAFDHMPILADALEEAGCNNQDILMHCRNRVPCSLNYGKGHHSSEGHLSTGPHWYCEECRGLEWVEKPDMVHVRGCWVIDLLLGNS